HPLATLADADKIRQDFPAYLASTAQPHIVFSGAGYTGLELAATLGAAAHRQGIHCRITMVEHGAEILPFLSSRQRHRVKNWLQRHDIQVLTNNQIIRFDGRNVDLSSGTKLTDVFLCRTAGTCAPLSLPADQAAALPDGRLLVADCLHLPDHPQVYAAGDAAAIRHRGDYLRKAVNFAIYSGARAGNNVARALRNRAALPFRPIDLGWVIPLMDDSVGTALNYLPLQGRAGLGLHYFMCGLRNFNCNNCFYFIKRACTATIRSNAR
ncbi:MAG: FAD-dependent oxidoreductase, partial [Lentisphaerae bacterium]|nr:FAD-dependent oxidoreductase [Lentisphaerota bacterium]